MNFCKSLLFLVSLLISSLGISQVYVGEVIHGDRFQYAKITITDSLTTFSLPYVDNDKKYVVAENIQTTPDWRVIRDLESWVFTTAISSNKLIGTLWDNGISQPVTFYRQLDALPINELSKYEGVFEDNNGNRAVVYAENGYLHIMSPYTGRTMSLKPIANQRFWSVSGEQSVFKTTDTDELTELEITGRFQNVMTLKKLPPIKVEETWVPVGKDSLYAKIFIPPTDQKVPACLVLPGGGATGMANYEYEARFFAAYGMVAMVFDKSGNGKSKGPGNFNLQTFEDKTAQYLQLFEFLQNQVNVDPTKVGVHGPSEGGRLALMMAIDEPEIAFVNATAAPITSMREGQLFAINEYLRNRGIPEADNIAIRTIWNEYYAGIIAGEINPKTIEKANVFREKYDRLFLPPNAVALPASPNKDDLLNDRVAIQAAKIRCPVFLQYGENDGRVPADKSIQNFYKYVSKDVPITLKIYPRANHSFMTPEYEISHGYTKDKRLWLQKIGLL